MSEKDRFFMARESRLEAEKLVANDAAIELDDFKQQRKRLFQDVIGWFHDTPISVESKEDMSLVLKNNDKALTIATNGFHLTATIHNHGAPEFHILLKHSLRDGSTCWEIVHFGDIRPRIEPFDQDSFFRAISLFA